MVNSTSIVTIGGYKKHWESLEHYWRRVIDREEEFQVERVHKTTSISAIAVRLSCGASRPPSTLSMTLTTSCRENAMGVMPIGG